MGTTGSLVSAAKPEFMKHIISVGILILTFCAIHGQTTLA